MNITVVGTGYVGLVSGTCFAETGNNVICVDIDADKVARMQNGEVPIFETGLEEMFDRNVKHNRLRFTTDLAMAVEHGDIIFLALPTPPGEGGAADLSYVLNAAEDISKMIKSYKIVVNKSTVPIGTAERVSAVLGEHLDDSLFDVVSNPEFLKEGVAIQDFMYPDRVVVGAESDRAFEQMDILYQPFIRQGNPLYKMDWRSAEMTKYAANSYLAARITFMNEIANLCEELGANVDQVRAGMGSDHRIGKRFLFPGVGYGGSCFPKDVEALKRIADQHDYDFKILDAVMRVNDRQKLKVFDKLMAHFNNDLKGKKIALWGLAFKPSTDDIREAPALYTIDALLDAGANVIAFDPEAMNNVKAIYGDKIMYGTDAYDALDGADALGIMTEWSVFRSPDFSIIEKTLKNKVIVDGRNLYDVQKMDDRGFQYYSIGRPFLKK